MILAMMKLMSLSTYLVKAMKKKKNMKYGKNSKEKYVPRCYECNEKGHLRSDCPKLEKEKGKDGEDPNRGKGKYKRSEKRGMIVKNSWGMSDADSVYSDEPSSSDTEMEQTKLVFVAIKEPEVPIASSSNAKVKSVTFSSKMCNVIPNENENDEDDGKFYFNNEAFDNAEDAFNSALDFIEKISPKVSKTQKDFRKLKRDFEAQEKELELMTIKFTESRDTLKSYDSNSI